MEELNIQELSDRCVDTYIADDILRHLEEECKEVMVALDRLRRDKGTFEEFLEELVDVTIEVNTVATLLEAKGLTTDEHMDEMVNRKLQKFKTILDRDQRAEGEPLKRRYKELFSE